MPFAGERIDVVRFEPARTINTVVRVLIVVYRVGLQFPHFAIQGHDTCPIMNSAQAYNPNPNFACEIVAFVLTAVLSMINVHVHDNELVQSTST